MTISVGFVGLGNMGNPMALNVLKNGFGIYYAQSLWNRKKFRPVPRP